MSECKGHPGREPRERWAPRPDGLEESVQFVPGYNCPATGPRSHGVHGTEIRWYLRGPKGTAQFVVYTDWIPGKLSPGHGLSPEGTYSWDSYSHPGELYYPMGADVGYHARNPQYAGQEPWSDHCPVNQGTCYYDGSGIRAEKLARLFVIAGEQAVFTELEDVYADIDRSDDA